MLRIDLGVIFLAALTGCAGVDFYSDAQLTKKTGIPIYAPKPYVLVARTDAEDKPVEVSIVYLNDVKNIIYASPRSGFGSNDLSLTLTDGRLATFGLKTDPKIAEMVTSLSGLLTARAGAAKTRAEADNIRSKIGTSQSAESKKAAGDAAMVVADDMIAKLNANSLRGLTASETKILGAQAQKLKLAATALADVTQATTNDGKLADVNAVTNELGKLGGGTASTTRDLSLQTIAKWALDLSSIVGDAAPSKAPDAAFELYEILQEGLGSPNLRRVQ